MVGRSNADSEPGSDAKIKDYFVNVVHISGDNYDKLKASLLKQASSLKSRVDAKDILVDLDFEGTMKKLYAKEVEAAQAAASTGTQPGRRRHLQQHPADPYTANPPDLQRSFRRRKSPIPTRLMHRKSPNTRLHT